MKTLKKTICLLLSCLMLLSCFSAFAFAADYDHLPQIYVEGIDSKRIYYKDDTEQEHGLFYPIDGERLLSNLVKYEKYIKQAILDENPNILRNYLYLWMQDCFGMIALDKDGYTMSDEVMVNETTLNYKGNGKYVFKYDSRLSPVDIAKELHEYVGWVQQHSGSERFELAGSSYGSAIVVAYINDYPEMKQYIDSIVLCVPSVNGVEFASELFSGEINLDPDAITSFVEDSVSNDDIVLLLKVLNKTGTLGAVLEAAVEPALRVALTDALRDVIHDIFGTFPSMWSFVDHEHFYTALENIYGEDYADPDHEYAVLINKLIDYHERIMVNAYDIVETAVADGVKMNIICKYGNTTIPLSKNGDIMGDGFVSLEKASFGATSGMNNKKLPENYMQALYPEFNFISPENCIDASTGLLPFNTWYIRGLGHGEKSDQYYDLINTVLYDDLDVFTSDVYPQYLEVPEYDDEALVPMTADASEEEKETSWLRDFLKLISNVLAMLVEKLKSLL